MDRWTPERFDQMRGNEAANAFFLYNLPSGIAKPKESDDRAREIWIKDKYARKKWVRKND